MYTLPVYPAEYTPAPAHAPPTYPVHARGHGKSVILGLRAYRLGAFRITFSQLKTSPATSRLLGQPGLSTSVCQAKLIKRLRIKKYSVRSKEALPEINSFSGDLAGHFTEPGRECWRARKRVFFPEECLFSSGMFSGKVLEKKVMVKPHVVTRCVSETSLLRNVSFRSLLDMYNRELEQKS